MTSAFDALPPVLTGLLFRPLGDALIALLRSLSNEDWSRQTSASQWNVRAVAAHLLDGDVRRLSMARDRHAPPAPEHSIASYDDLVKYLDTLNADWVRATQRVSPRMLTELLEVTTPAIASLMEATDPWSSAVFPVAWAGQETSPMWLDVGREYTERWHHQDQIRDATGRPPLDGPEFLTPVIGISMFALPHAWRLCDAPRNTCIVIEATGAAGGTWHLEKHDDWHIGIGRGSGSADCRITIRDLDLARLLLHRLDPAAARSAVRIEGNTALAELLFDARAVMVTLVPERPDGYIGQ